MDWLSNFWNSSKTLVNGVCTAFASINTTDIGIADIGDYSYKKKLNKNLQEVVTVKIEPNDNEVEIKKKIIGVFHDKGYEINENDITLNKKHEEKQFSSFTINNLLITKEIMKKIEDEKNDINNSKSDDNEFSKKIDDFCKCLENNLNGNKFYEDYYNELKSYIKFLKECKDASHVKNYKDLNDFEGSYLENNDNSFIEKIFEKIFGKYKFIDEKDIEKLKNELKNEFKDKFNKNSTKVNIYIKNNNVLKDKYKKKFENIQNKYKRGTFEFLSYCIILEKLRKSFEQANIKLYNKIDGNLQLIITDDNNDLFLKRGEEYEIYVEFPNDFYKTIYHDKSVGTNDEKKGIGGNIDYLDEDDEEIKDNSNKKQRGRCRCLRNCLKKNR